MLRLMLLALVVVVAFERTAQAQNTILAQLYGQGVHAYYSGDSLKAYDLLSKSIDGGIKDPRAYYFRGLTAVSSGREYEAEADYRAGAELEAKGNFGPSVGQALARIQGSHRMAIESMRQQAQLEFQASASARSKARYQDMDAAGANVLRERPVPAPPIAQPGRRPAPPAAPPAAGNPFAQDNATGEAKVESKDVLADTMKDPFADDAAPAMGGEAPAAGTDPFDGGAPAADAGMDPFGSAPAEAPAAAGSDPFGADPSDPFGN